MDHTPAAFFKELVESALSRQQMRANELTSYYLVDLLCRFVRPDQRIPYNDNGDEPLAFRLERALESGGLEQRARLRNLGDFSLLMSGFFSDSFLRSVVDVDYYVSMGEYAYGSLSRREADAYGEVYSDLSRNFVPFMDVLADVSDQTTTRSSVDVLRLYEKWLRTGSPRDGQRLAERGIVQNASIGNKFIQ